MTELFLPLLISLVVLVLGMYLSITHWDGAPEAQWISSAGGLIFLAGAFSLIAQIWISVRGVRAQLVKLVEQTAGAAERVSELLTNQQQLLEMIARGASLQTTLDEIVLFCERMMPEWCGSVLLLQPQSSKLQTASAPSLPIELVEKVDSAILGRSVCALTESARGNGLHVIRDIENEKLPREFQRTALLHGYRSCWSIAIISLTNEQLGTYGMYSRTLRSPSQKEVELLESFVAIAAIAIERDRNERRLVQSKDTAEAATRAKSQFLANVSHELRTPLNGILGMTELVLESELADEQRTSLELVRYSSHALLALINDLLDFSRIEANRLTLSNEPFELRNFVDKTMALLSVRADQKHLVFVSKVEENVPDHLVGDMIRLGQVINNLLANAIKFTNLHGAVFFYVGLEEMKAAHSPGQTSDEVVLHCAVTDTGIGIPSHRQAAIFEPFIQADASTTRRYGGTGLGLSISRRLVELMNGRLWINSREDIGSAFHFTATFSKEASEFTQINNIGSSGEWRRAQYKLKEYTEQVHKKIGSLNILLAEDNVVNEKVIRAMLKKGGFDVVSVLNGEMVLEQLQNNQFDLILMDCHMPVLDGLEATRAIREAEKNTGRHVPIIGLTADSGQGAREKVLLSGMDEYVSKPISRVHLFEAINRVLGTLEQS